jgi:D-alanyl-D-alanine-carboxypeptidase/D-alanyl-D-alanine-endopeptidase
MSHVNRHVFIGLVLSLVCWVIWLPGLAEPAVTLQQQVDDYAAQSLGSRAVAALLVTPEGTEMALAGKTGNSAHPVPTADTLFEIGSITKVFTALLLADQVNQGVVTLDTPAEALLPSQDPLSPTSLQALASHTAGLPRLPLSRILRASLYPANPYRGSQPEELYRAIAAADPEPGTCQYSNLGPALLGQLLATAAGQPYETLMQTQVLAPLGLTDTHFDLDVAARNRLAQGHQGNTLPTTNWQLDAYAPAGGLKSSLTDMGRFLQAAMATDWPPLALSLQPHSEDCEPNFGLGWVLTELEDAPMIMHNGRTGGYYAFLGWLPEAGRGLVLLTNTSDAQGDQVAAALLTGEALPTRDFPFGILMVTAFLGGMLMVQGWQLARPLRSPDRFKVVENSVEVLVLLAFSYQLGPWQWLPIAFWWGLLALFVGLTLRRLWQLPWRSPSESSPPVFQWRYLRLVPTLLVLAWVVLCLR